MKRIFSFVMVMMVTAFAYAERPSIDEIQANSQVKALNCSSFKDERLNDSYPENNGIIKVSSSILRKPVIEGMERICTISGRINPGELDVYNSIDYFDQTIKNGLVYKVYSDGSGSVKPSDTDILSRVDSWSFNCKRDMIDGSRECYLSSDVNYKDFKIFRGSYGYIVSVGWKNFPGLPSRIRVEGSRPFSTMDRDGDFPSSTSRQIINQMRQASAVFVSYSEWPYRDMQQSESSLKNFTEALDFMDAVYKAM
jgi:hypothetical protein